MFQRSGSATLTVTPHANLALGLELKLKLGLSSPFVRSASVRLFGSAGIGMKIRFDFKGR